MSLGLDETYMKYGKLRFIKNWTDIVRIMTFNLLIILTDLVAFLIKILNSALNKF